MKIYVDTNVIIDYCLQRNGKFGLDYQFAFDFFRRGIDCEFYLVVSDWAEKEALKYVEQKKIDELLEHISSKLIKIKMSEKQRKEAYRLSRTNWPDARHAIMARDEKCFKMATKDGDFHAFSHIVGSAYPQSI
jgi:predicted nucleic acid-binding protein